MSRIDKSRKSGSGTVLRTGERGMRGYYLMRTGFLFGVMKRVWNWVVVIVAQYCEGTKSH